jgi:D-alanine-D-alanine ligase
MHNKYFTRFIPHSKTRTIRTQGTKHVALIAGGMSAEREVSLSSAAGVQEALVKLGYQVTFIDMGADIATILTEIKPDVVYNCLHGTFGEDGCLQGLLNIMHIPYTHSGVLASSIALNKKASKALFKTNPDLDLADSFVISKNNFADNISKIKKPFVLKPISQGSSIGVEIVLENDDFDISNYTFPFGDVMIEEYIKGREMQVAVLNGNALGVLEIELINEKKFYDYEAKYTDGFTRHLMPAKVPSKIEKKLLQQAELAVNTLDCTGIVRVEFIYQEDSNRIVLLEINTHPGMTPLSICPEIAGYNGISFVQLVEEILKTARFEE